jgi:methionyl-tRNA formyltransferase
MSESIANWWCRPRPISVLVDNDSWILPYSRDLVEWANVQGDDARLCRNAGQLGEGGIAFLLGCTKLIPQSTLDRNRINLVVHESDLPLGRGFAPLTWQILEGEPIVPVRLFEAVSEADAGSVYGEAELSFEGTELCDELRHAQGRITVKLCQEYLAASAPPMGRPQMGQPTWCTRRGPEDSRLDPHKTLADQFELLRVVDNDRYPAFFDFRGRRYRIRIEPDPQKAPIDGQGQASSTETN